MRAQISPRASVIVRAVKAKYGPGLALFSREIQVSLIRAEAWLVLAQMDGATITDASIGRLVDAELEAERVLLG